MAKMTIYSLGLVYDACQGYGRNLVFIFAVTQTTMSFKFQNKIRYNAIVKNYN